MTEIGDSLGRYTLLKRLAAGGMGEVYLAAKPGPVGFGPYVAVKILRDELANDQQFIDMLVDEANISMFLNHQNVVSVLDLSEDDGTYYIAMEYVQGVTVEGVLERLIAQGRKLDLPLGLYIASELCRALKYAHTRVNHNGEPINIIHRDVTPANILLSIQGEVKLTDFGIARAKGRIHQTQAGVLKGKFGYMAPEMIRYEQIDARADLFCAGVVIYLMLTGRHPVAGATVMEAIARYEEKQIPRPSQVNQDVPATLDQIVMRALEPKPDNRWSTAAALGAALQDAVLRNPSWRREVQDGAQHLAHLIREIAPEAFEDPISSELSAQILRKAQGHEPLEPSLRPESTAPSAQNPIAILKEPTHDTFRPPGPKPPGARTPPRRTESGPTTDRHAASMDARFDQTPTHESQVPEHLSAMAEPPPDAAIFTTARDPGAGDRGANPDLETEEGLQLADVFAARALLMNEADERRLERTERSGPSDRAGSNDRAAPDTADLLDQTVLGPPIPDLSTSIGVPGSKAAPAADREASAIEVAFPESSTDRHRIHEQLLSEPVLRDPSETPDLSELLSRAATPGHDALADGATVVSAYNAPGLDDGRTVAGMQMLGEPDAYPRAQAPGDEADPEERPHDADATRAYSSIDVLANGRALRDDDLETVIPLGPDIPLRDSDGGEWIAPDGGPGDATLLDGLDMSSVQSALQAQRAQRASKPAPPAPLVKGPIRAAPPRQEVQAPRPDLDMDALIADSLRTGAHKSDSTVPGPALLNGPVRIVVGQDGSPSLGPVNPANPVNPVNPVNPGAVLSPSGIASAAAVLAQNAGNDALKKKPATAPIREKKRTPSAGVPTDRPESSVSASSPNPDEVGAQTRRWIAGELGAHELEWDDDAAARRAVATRNQAGPGAARNNQPSVSVPSGSFPPGALAGGGGAPPGAVYPGPGGASDPRISPTGLPRPSPLVPAQNWMPFVAVAAALIAVGVVAGVLIFSRVLWPKLKLESEPTGATVIIDDVQAPQPAPVTVQVAPGRPHMVELRLEGYRTERREISDGVGRGRTYTLQVGLRRIVPQLEIRPVEATVLVNGQKVTKGSRVQLFDLSPSEPVKIRVEAPGYRPWEQSFERGAIVPESIDVPLTEQPPSPKPPDPPPARPTPRRR